MKKYTDMPYKEWDGTFPLYLKDENMSYCVSLDRDTCHASVHDL